MIVKNCKKWLIGLNQNLEEIDEENKEDEDI